MYKLRLQSVDSRNATQEELDRAGIDEAQIPLNRDGHLMNIAAHQAATVQALRYGTSPIIINQAMTGDGKTLAGRFQLFSEKWRSFAMYPTNELAYDQGRSFDELLDDWQPKNWNSPPRKKLINAHEIDKFSFGDDDINASRMDEIEGMMTQRDYILTNPDIFHLIMNFTYKQRGVASDFLPTFVANRFRLYIFDEFHLFGVEQIASVMIAMLLLGRLVNEAQPPRFLFLSATPQEMLRSLAERVGLEVELIRGDYQHGHNQPAEGYRRILQKTDLSLYSGSGRLEDWVIEHLEDTIKPFFLENKVAATGLIIANSVATAHRIYRFLKENCEPAIRIGINTGLTPKADRNKPFDLLVATSTVDVGVDFKINFLVFESRDAASHQQRLGRLGRHATDKDGNPFRTFEAHAILPAWTVEGLAQAFPDGDTISREAYKDELEAHFSPLQQFQSYIGRWAGVQAGKLLSELRQKDIYTQYRVSREVLENEFKALFGKSVRKYFALVKSQAETVNVASSFRGGSIFTALIQDPETDSKDIMNYNLMTLLRNADLQAVEIKTILDEAKRRGQSTDSLQKSKPLAAYRLRGWLDKAREIWIGLDAELPAERHETVIEQNRFRIDCPGVPELQALNNELYTRVLVAFIIPDKDPDMVRRLLRLGFQNELYSFTALGNLKGTIVFWRDALLIDSVLLRRKTETAFIW